MIAPRLLPTLNSSGFCGKQGVFLPQIAQSFAQGAQRELGVEWVSSYFAIQKPCCPRGAMSAGDADAVVRVFSLCSKQACRLDFLLLKPQYLLFSFEPQSLSSPVYLLSIFWIPQIKKSPFQFQ